MTTTVLLGQGVRGHSMGDQSLTFCSAQDKACGIKDIVLFQDVLFTTRVQGRIQPLPFLVPHFGYNARGIENAEAL